MIQMLERCSRNNSLESKYFRFTSVLLPALTSGSNFQFRVRFPSRCNAKLNAELKDLIWRLICVDPQNRMHVSMLHLHNWMRRPDMTKSQMQSLTRMIQSSPRSDVERY